MHTRSLSLAIVLVLLSLVISGCARPAQEAAPADLRPIAISHVSVEIGVGSPIPVEVVASGEWPDLCAQVAQVNQSVQGAAIAIELLATEETPGCPPDFVGIPFRMAIPLNGVELPANQYTVTVNGVSASFTWPPAP